MFTTTLHILETTFIHHGGILWDHLLARESFLFHFDGSPTGQHNPNCTQGHGKKRLWHACDKRPWRRWRSPAEQAFHIEGGTDRNPSRPFSDQRIEMLLERATCRLVGRPTRWCYLEIGDEQCAIWIQEMSNVLFGSRRWAMCYLDTGDEKCWYIQEMSNVLPGDRRSVDLQVCTLLPLDRERPGFDLPIIIISSWSFLLYCYIVTSSLKS